ncbi:LysR family transcriptional regulator [Pseudonocardia sp. MH-G8]|nr:LysR family transcriptional regulator [Pseudonocardia sp. MH-G8]
MKTDRTHHGTERRPVDTELLRTFVAVVQSHGFTAAARELGYVQSTVTGHVQTLERRLGARLLDRLPAGAVPTEAGLRLLPYAEQLLSLQARMVAEVPSRAGRPAGTVRLIAPESLCASRLPALVAAVRAAEPAVRLALAPGGTAAALDAVRRASTDIALVLEPVLTVADLHLDAVGTEDVVLLDAPDRDRTAAPVTWSDLAGRDALLLEEGCSYSDDAARRLLAAGQPAARRTRFGSIEAVKRCVAAGLGWTVLPAVTAAAELQDGTLVALAGPPVAACTVHLVTHPDRSTGPAVRVVVDHLRALLTQP